MLFEMLCSVAILFEEFEEVGRGFPVMILQRRTFLLPSAGFAEMDLVVAGLCSFNQWSRHCHCIRFFNAYSPYVVLSGLGSLNQWSTLRNWCGDERNYGGAFCAIGVEMNETLALFRCNSPARHIPNVHFLLSVLYLSQPPNSTANSLACFNSCRF